MNKRFFLLAISLLSTLAVVAQRMVEGNVFIDENRNGICDKGEELLAGIPVSNGRDIVVTNAKGCYRIALPEGFSLFPILPADLTIDRSRLVNAHFINSRVAQKRNNNFALVRKPVKKHFQLNLIGDVQVSNYQELDYATRSLWPELLDGAPSDLNLFMGDLVNNNLSLYGRLRQLMEQLPQQTWTVLGNHDRDVDSLRRRQSNTYTDFFGSDVYAFNEGQVHFIVLNNVFGEGTRGYTGQLTDEQLTFVRNDLQYIPANALVVLCMHIPLSETRNRNQLIELFRGRDHLLAITGHLHRVMRFFYEHAGVKVHELGVGASCGFWWVGEKDWQGLPAALQQGGAPRNYFVMKFDDNRYQFRFKGIGLDERRQMNIHIMGIDSLDQHLRDFKEVAPHQAIITVWGGCDSTQVRCRIDGGAWQTCAKASLIDPNVARIREMNLLRAYPTKYNRVNPMRRQASPQLWTVVLTDEQCRNAHTIEVEASDRFGFHATGRRAYAFP